MEESFRSESSSDHSQKRLRYYSSDSDTEDDRSGGILHIDLDRFPSRRPRNPSISVCSSVNSNSTAKRDAWRALSVETSNSNRMSTTSSYLPTHGLLSEVLSDDPLFFLIPFGDVNSGIIYNPSLKKWHHPNTIYSLPRDRYMMPVGSAGGLVCFADFLKKNFYVCNPLTQSYKELPASDRDGFLIAAGMISGGNGASTAGYQILQVASDGKYEVYSSKRASWTQPGIVPSSVMLLPSLTTWSLSAVSIDETLYFLRRNPEGIVSYNMVTGVWEEYVVPSPLFMSHSTLAGCGKQILLVGLLTRNAVTFASVWELQKMTLLWEEFDRMPKEWCLEFYGKHLSMRCVVNKDQLMLSLKSKQMNRLVTYNPKTREWLKAPLPPAWVPRQRWVGHQGTAFHPCQTAVP